MASASKVYFVKVSESDPVESVNAKLSALIDSGHLFDFIKKSDSTAVKMHFGEEGNMGHVRAEYAGVVCRKLLDKGAVPFLTDTNTLYRGRRTNSSEHIKLAAEHGFTKKTCSVDIVVPDDAKKENVIEVAIDGKFFKTAKVAAIFMKSDSLVGIAHFKGHVMTGFGGALKNIGMGCASREGKLAQHSEIAPVLDVKRCKTCGACIKACPANAIYSQGTRVVIDSSKCIGCATCIAVCVHNAIEVDWESGGMQLQDKMIEYASAILLNKKGKQAFINFVTKITKECDCLAKDDPRIAPDIGIFASLDPVAVDQASYDAVSNACGKDIFKAVHPDRDSLRQLKRAEQMALGSRDYELKEL